MAGEIERIMATPDRPRNLELAQRNGPPEYDTRLARMVAMFEAMPENHALGANIRSIGSMIHDYEHHREEEKHLPMAAFCLVVPLMFAAGGAAVGAVLGAACKGAKDLAQDDFELDSFLNATWKTGAILGGVVGVIGCCRVITECNDRPYMDNIKEQSAITQELANSPDERSYGRLKARQLYLKDEIFFHNYRPPFIEEGYTPTQH